MSGHANGNASLRLLEKEHPGIDAMRNSHSARFADFHIMGLDHLLGPAKTGAILAGF